MPAKKKASTPSTGSAASTGKAAPTGPAAGAKAPGFDLESDAGKRVSLGDFAGKWLVLYFYPKDSTPGCTREAQGFTAAAAELKKLGAAVVGVSKDSVTSHCGFKQKFGIGFPLLSDATLAAHRAYGAFGKKVMYGKAVEGVIRSTFLLAPDGKVAKAWRSVKVDGHVEAVLGALRELPPVTVDAPATVAWIAPEPPDADQARALASWAHARGVRLVSPRLASAPVLRVDEHAADEVERALDRGRDAIAARDAEGVDRALAAAEALLRAHPELPQAAWQMAEVERTRSARFRRVPPVDEEAAERAWGRARALDGGRLAGVGEQASAAAPSTATITLEVTPRDASAWLDGRLVSSGIVAVGAGLHALVVTWDDAPVWATWIDVPAGRSTVRADAPASPPCSADDVGRAALAGDSVDAQRVRCGAWVAAVPGAAPTSVRVATCESGRCGPLLDWRTPTWTWTPPPERTRRGWPAWATWGIVGAGAAAVATGVLVVATGALQHPAPETRFVVGGVKQE